MWGVGACAHKAFSGPIRLLPEVEDLWSWFPCLAMPFKAQVHTEQEEAQSSLFLWRAKCRGETRMRYFPEPTRIGAELGFRRSVSLSRMQLPEASFVPFLRWALGGSLPSWRKEGAGASSHKAFSGPIRLLPEVEHVGSWYPAPETTSTAPVPRKQ